MYSIVRQMVLIVCSIDSNAAASYTQAEHIIRLITGVLHVVNNKPDVGNLLKLIFLPNYNVTLAEFIIPANDLWERSYTEGMEDSGHQT